MLFFELIFKVLEHSIFIFWGGKGHKIQVNKNSQYNKNGANQPMIQCTGMYFYLYIFVFVSIL